MATIGDEVINPTGGGPTGLALIGGTGECIVHDSMHRRAGRLSRIPSETLGCVNEGSGRIVVGVVWAVRSVAVIEWAIVVTPQPMLDLPAKCRGIRLRCQHAPHAIEWMAAGNCEGPLGAGWKLKVARQQTLCTGSGNRLVCHRRKLH